jgi:hypothetical protein
MKFLFRSLLAIAGLFFLLPLYADHMESTFNLGVGGGPKQDTFVVQLTLIAGLGSTAGTYTVSIGGQTGTLTVDSNGNITATTGAVTLVSALKATSGFSTQDTGLQGYEETYTVHYLPVGGSNFGTIAMSVVAPNGTVFWATHATFTDYYFWQLYNTIGGNPFGATFTQNARNPTTYTKPYTVNLAGSPEPCPPCAAAAGNTGSCPTCGSAGMTTYSLDKLRGSFRLTDTPVSYGPPVGPSIGFTLNYNQGYLGQLPVQPFSNVSPNWTYLLIPTLMLYANPEM